MLATLNFVQDRILSDRYRIVRHLARGGMADVFEAEDTLLNRSVAVKALHANFASDHAFVTRFRREAQAAANLSHPNIVAIYDWGQDNGTYYMVMELIKGKTLRDLMKADGAILPRRAAEIAAETAAALSIAHQHGVYHRDVKPGNIMITEQGAVKVTDFGIARALDDSEELTRTGAVIGTATYFSPEQAQGLPADERSDVYSLGVVLYEMLAGQPPFSGESPVAVAYQHVSEPATPTHEINPESPIELGAISAHAMKKAPTDRYQTAAEMRADLLRYLDGSEPIAAGAAVAAAATAMITAPGAAAGTMAVGYADTSSTFNAPAREQSQTGYWAAVGGLVVVLGLGVWLLLRLLSGGDPATETVPMPNLTGVETTQAFEVLQELGLKFRTQDEPSDEIPAGRVIRTDPGPGTEVPVGEFVTLYVSVGAEEFGVPNVLNESEDIARSRIIDQGFVVGNVTYQPTDDTDENIVINQSPPGGTTAAPGTAVDLVVSSGPAAIEVPDVSGRSSDQAVIRLTRDGFTNIETQEEFSPNVLAGFVIETNPAAGQVVPTEATITVIVSKGPEPVSVPNLSGMSQGQAQSALNALGLTLVVSADTVPVPLNSGLVGNVAEQSPGQGQEVEVGSQVVVKLGVVQQVAVPDFVGELVADAQAQAIAVGLDVDIAGTVTTANQALDGTVESQGTPPGSSVDEGTIINIIVYVYQAPPTTTIP